MLYESTRILLRSIVQCLARNDDIAWDDQIESGRECLYEVHQMTRAPSLLDKTAYHGWSANIPDLGILHRAIPHVKEMVTAIQRKDQAAALRSGKAALAEMNGANLSLPARAVESPPLTQERL
jgi:hypothetical protein